MRRFAALIVTFTVGLAVPASAGGPDNVVNASPTADGAQIHRAHVQVATTGADTVDSSNLALAHPHDCAGCEGVAVAFQAVIVRGDPSTVSPRNVAAAVNSDCTSCNAFAFAYQYVVSADGDAHLSDDARAQIDDIRAQADDLVDSGLPDDQLDAKLQALEADFKAAVRDGLQSPHTEAVRERESQ
jgi:putative peptide zinc metalloprotease protein